MFRKKSDTRMPEEMGNAESHQKDPPSRTTKKGKKKDKPEKDKKVLRPLHDEENPYTRYYKEDKPGARRGNLTNGGAGPRHDESYSTNGSTAGKDEIAPVRGVEEIPGSSSHGAPSPGPPLLPSAPPGSLVSTCLSPTTSPNQIMTSASPSCVVDDELLDYYTVSTDKLELRCRFISAGSRLSQCDWSKDGHTLPVTTDPRLSSTFVEGFATLTIQEAVATDSGQYTARAHSLHRAAETTCNVYIHDIGDIKRLVNSRRTHLLDMDLSSIFPHLKEKNILTDHKQQEIELKGIPRHQNDAFIGYMLTRPDQDFKTLFSALRQDYGFIVENIFKSECGLSGASLESPQSLVMKERPPFDASLYHVIDEAMYEEFCQDGLTLPRILAKDADIKERLDSELQNYVLAKNQVGSRDKLDHLNIVFIGKTGVGKSATANTFIGQTIFQECRASESQIKGVEEYEHRLAGRTFKLIDTPGFIAPNRAPEDIAFEVAKIFELCPDGVHVFLYTQQATDYRFTAEQQQAKQQAELIFGERILKHTAMVLTHAGSVFKKASLQSYVATELRGSAMEAFVDALGGHVVAVENKAESQYACAFMSQALLDVIDTVVQSVDNTIYTHEWFHLAQRVLNERARIRAHHLSLHLSSHTAQFHQDFRQAKELAHPMVKDYFRPKQLLDMAEEQADQYDEARRLLISQLRTSLESSHAAVYENLCSLCHAGLNPFQDIINELIHTSSCTHQYQRALEEGNDAKKLLYKQSLNLQDCVQTVLTEMNEQIKSAFSSSPEYSIWCSEELAGEIRERVRNRLGKQGDACVSNIEEEIERLSEFEVAGLRYTRRIELYMEELEQVIWAEIQSYVRKLNRKQLEEMAEYDYQRIQVETQHKLPDHVHAYFSETFIRQQICQQAINKRSDLQQLVNSFSAAIYRTLQNFLSSCIVM